MSAKKQNKLRELQEKYLAQLPEKIDALNRAWLDAVNNNNQVSLEQLRQFAHNLAGSAGTFGFSAISVISGGLEKFLNKNNDINDFNSEEEKTVSDALQKITRLVDLGPEKENETITDLVGQIEHALVKADAKDNKLIYILEDDKLLASEVASQLSYFDYQVEVFFNVSAALEAIKLHTPAAIIVDLQLPDGSLSGASFAEQVDKASGTHVPSIYLSQG